MMMEAVAKGFVTVGNVPSKLKSRPEIVSQLTDYWDSVSQIMEGNILVLGTDATTVNASISWRQRYGLLINDSVSIALMNQVNINVIATNDRDFESIEGLSVHMPGDL